MQCLFEYARSRISTFRVGLLELYDHLLRVSCCTKCVILSAWSVKVFYTDVWRIDVSDIQFENICRWSMQIPEVRPVMLPIPLDILQPVTTSKELLRIL